ncbi:hypothetical protein [Actinocatenispora rupis]|uniref:Uncharacterized protein n=1 Tax=Actinocatenispora rupis TaxID=519421 RepID=A0A8J3J212_9ACTN|nr:hypothetical protein [Actinocatenispora rupis]GID14306.1 hypothetical protein Aru02nite_51950 [Actinocatenispora rupis]
MRLTVHLRPNAAYLAILAIGAAAVAYAIVVGSVLVGIPAGVLTLVLGAPVVVSTVCRVPVVAVDERGLRLPLMSVRLAWPDVAGARPGTRLGGRAPRPVLLVFPRDPRAVAGRVRPWLRSEARTNLTRYGTPIVLAAASLDRSLDEIAAAVRHHVEHRDAARGQ